MPEIWKKFNFKAVIIIFEIFDKMHKFWNLKFRSQSFNKVLVSKVSLDHITDY